MEDMNERLTAIELQSMTESERNAHTVKELDVKESYTSIDSTGSDGEGTGGGDETAQKITRIARLQSARGPMAVNAALRYLQGIIKHDGQVDRALGIQACNAIAKLTKPQDTGNATPKAKSAPTDKIQFRHTKIGGGA